MLLQVRPDIVRKAAKQKALQLAQQFQEETKKKIAVGVLAPIEQIAADAQVATREQDIITAQQVVGVITGMGV